MENLENGLFPIRFEMHIAIALIGLLVFGLQFIRHRKYHHLAVAIAFPLSLLPYLSEDLRLFNAVGVIEAVILVLALVLRLTVDREKKPAADKAQDDAYAEAAAIIEEAAAMAEKNAAEAAQDEEAQE